MPWSSNIISVFQITATAALDSSVMSDDISVAPEVQAALESNRHQQIVLFVYANINGHSEEQGGKEDTVGEEGEGKSSRRRWR